jgi:hypothetical protein
VSDQIQPAALTNLRIAQLVNVDVSLAGWGKKENGENPVIMDTVDVTVLRTTDCEDRIEAVQGRPIRFETSVFCTAANPFALIHQVRRIHFFT